ncbi:hypothetical protein VKT23_006060 [Stygiomarasmius scandens]|uniref:CHAT domain-containing protein n=1 Tax=Marasmiellus scandens TaxID=2682957 RepID=A0ABR1JQ27_9AGAR
MPDRLTVIVNADVGCDALVLFPSKEIIHVPLPDFSDFKATELTYNLRFYLKAHHLDQRKSYPNPLDDPEDDVEVLMDIKDILGILWISVVKPILSTIDKFGSQYKQGILHHITWCVTGRVTFLPLHAAGIYGCSDPTQNINISQFAVSSYAPTLTSLLESHSKLRQNQTKTPKVLIVSQPNTPGQAPLPGTIDEAKVIQKYASVENTLLLNSQDATLETVLQEMNKNLEGVPLQKRESEDIVENGRLKKSSWVIRNSPRKHSIYAQTVEVCC